MIRPKVSFSFIGVHIVFFFLYHLKKIGACYARDNARVSVYTLFYSTAFSKSHTNALLAIHVSQPNHVSFLEACKITPEVRIKLRKYVCTVCTRVNPTQPAAKGNLTGNICLLSTAHYCSFGNFRKNLIFANSIKRRISDVKSSRLRQDLPISIIERVILPFREGLFSRNYAHAKFRENKVLAKISEFTVLIDVNWKFYILVQ